MGFEQETMFERRTNGEDTAIDVGEKAKVFKSVFFPSSFFIEENDLQSRVHNKH